MTWSHFFTCCVLGPGGGALGLNDGSQAGVGEEPSSAPHWRIRGGFACMCMRASASLPTQSGPFCSHSVADAPPLAALMDAKLCSGDKRRDRSPRPTRAFHRDALRLLLAPHRLHHAKPSSPGPGGGESFSRRVKWRLADSARDGSLQVLYCP